MRFHRCPEFIFCIKNNNKNHELFITHLWEKEMHDAILNPVTSDCFGMNIVNSKTLLTNKIGPNSLKEHFY